MFKGFSPAADILLLKFEEEFNSLTKEEDKINLIAFKKKLIKNFEKYFKESNLLINSDLPRNMKIVFLKRNLSYFKRDMEYINLMSDCRYEFTKNIKSLIDNVLATKHKKLMAKLKFVPFLGFDFSSSAFSV